ncbi:MAG: hypothetical protein ACKOTZ_14030 [Chloroflexota bacterium]
MAVPLSSLIRPRKGPSLAALERLAPAPSADLVAAEIEARTGTGDIVLELHGRGGWVARSAVDRLRRAYTIESSALTGLLAELVLRPPDLRHLDATMAALANASRGGTGLRSSIEQAFQTSCPDCGNPARIEELVWEAEADVPSRRLVRCPHCRIPRGELRPVALSPEDRARARAIAAESTARDQLLGRFPIPSPDHALPGELLDLYTPRALDAIAALIDRIEGDLRAPSIQAALRLALVHCILPASRLNAWQGRIGSPRVSGGHLRATVPRQHRERDLWSLFEEGFRAVRAFVQRMDGTPAGYHHARYGRDLAALLDGSANVVLAHGSITDPRVAPRLPPNAGGRAASRVRLVLTQPPLHWTADTLGFAYLATSLVLGYDAAATLPLDGLFGAIPRSEWAWDAVALRRSLGIVREVLAPDGRVVLLLDPTGQGGLVAGVLGGVGAGLRLSDALLAEAGDQIAGTLEFRPPDAPDDEDRSYPDLPAPEPDAPFSLRTVRAAVTETAVAALRARGEPAREERLLGEILVGLDRLGHLARLAGADGAAAGSREGIGSSTDPAAAATPEAPGVRSWRDPARSVRGGHPATRSGVGEGDRADGAADAGDEPFAGVLPPPVGRGLAAPGPGAPEAGPARGGAAASASRDAADPTATDPVRLVLKVIGDELRRPDHPRLVELEPGRWWLRDDREIAEARPPLSDRIEWAVFSLLTTTDGIAEGAFYDRIAGMFRGYDAPDEEIVRACLESHAVRDPGPDGVLRALDLLRARHAEHGALVAQLADLGRRLGMRIWIARREQRRVVDDRPLGDLLTDAEKRVYLPLVHPGPPDALDAVDCIWYVRGRATWLFEVEWTAMLDDPVTRRGGRIPTTDTLVRFLVIPPERTELVRLKLERSPLLRRRMEEDNWHILKSDHLLRLCAAADPHVADLSTLIGLDPEIERDGGQMPLFR